MGEGKVWIGTVRDRKSVIDVITLGFSSDPMARWTLPNPAQYLAVMPEVVDAFGGKAFEHGSVYCVDDFSGAALWLPPGTEPDSERLGALIALLSAERARSAFEPSSTSRADRSAVAAPGAAARRGEAGTDGRMATRPRLTCYLLRT